MTSGVSGILGEALSILRLGLAGRGGTTEPLQPGTKRAILLMRLRGQATRRRPDSRVIRRGVSSALET